jgi:hypothetical protein
MPINSPYTTPRLRLGPPPSVLWGGQWAGRAGRKGQIGGQGRELRDRAVHGRAGAEGGRCRSMGYLEG